eukprot:GFUD01002302.1.p1 GENE.GFUD01002302.1~~GFUD01002302.1.p1  ORF type:complete len:603 (+),score=206.05 GFUD01002302.1:67-1875(+)
MSFWQENFAFIKDVFDDRSEKMVDVMNKCEQAIAEVLADKIYTSAEFKKVKENFSSFAKNLEQSEVKEWLENTKETLMGDRDAKSKGDEDKKLEAVLGRFDALLPKVTDTKKACDSLWKAYQYTDELTPHMEWLVEKRVLATRDINSNSAGETEELIEKQEKVIDQLDKKRKVFQEIIAKGTKLKDDPKCPVFLGREVKTASDLWDETNKTALDRLNRLRDNLSAWERYENKRNDLAEKLAVGDRELADIKKVYDVAAGETDHKNRIKTAASIRKEIEGVFKAVDDANNIVQVLLTEDMQAELNEQVSDLKARAAVNDQIDEKLKMIDAFNGKLKTNYIVILAELEGWNAGGRKRMDELLNPTAPIQAEDRVLQTMELGEDIRAQIEIHTGQQSLWDSELAPSQAGEDSVECKELMSRMGTVFTLLSALNDESEAEAAKFGEDVKHLADVTNSTKKFAPWIQTSGEKVKAGMKKASSLGEATVLLDELNKWKVDSENMKKVIDNGNAAAHKMTMHDDADKVYAANCKSWEVVSAAVKDWITKMEALVKMWESQAATADKVTAAMSAPSDSDMKLEDLEAHLNSLKQMFIEKQKMMDSLNPSA